MPEGQGKNHTVEVIVARQSSLIATTARHVFEYGQPWVDAIMDDSICSKATLGFKGLYAQKEAWGRLVQPILP